MKDRILIAVLWFGATNGTQESPDVPPDWACDLCNHLSVEGTKKLYGMFQDVGLTDVHESCHGPERFDQSYYVLYRRAIGRTLPNKWGPIGRDESFGWREAHPRP